MPGDFVQTETAAAIMGTLNLILIRALDGGGVTMIAGASGIGKTTTPLDFAAGLAAMPSICGSPRAKGVRLASLAASVPPQALPPHQARARRMTLPPKTGASMMKSSSWAVG